MKIIIASTIVPFIEGGGTFIVDWLGQKLKEYGHQVDVLKIPFSSYYKAMLPQILALRRYHLEDQCDRLICIRMPSYLIPHPSKYLWFIHHYREIYDIWGTELDYLPKDSETYAIREYIKRADDVAFAEARKIYTNSKIVSKRLLKFNGVSSTPLYPPLYDSTQFFCQSYGDYIYYTSRICRPKRQHLIVEAMRYTKTPVKLKLSGKAEDLGYIQEIQRIIRRYRLEQKVEIIDRWISEEEKCCLFADCLASAYIPFDEDSYGYPSLEAHESCKAVLSCTDSGGTDELILDGENGFLCDPSPKRLAEKMDFLYENRDISIKMGQRGKERLQDLGINWDTVIQRFTE